MQIKKELQKNKQVMQEAFRDCGDIIMREFRIRGGEGTLFLAYTDNIVNGVVCFKRLLNQSVRKSLKTYKPTILGKERIANEKKRENHAIV